VKTSIAAAGPAGKLQAAAAGRKVCRKYRKASIRRLQQVEYDRLCRIVPSLVRKRCRRHISKITVVEETIRYIDQLHHALVNKVQTKPGHDEVSSDDVVDAARRTFLDVRLAAAAAAILPVNCNSRRTSTPPCIENVVSTAAVAATVITSGSATCENDRRVVPSNVVIKADMLSR
jgi:hypothetical protein